MPKCVAVRTPGSPEFSLPDPVPGPPVGIALHLQAAEESLYLVTLWRRVTPLGDGGAAVLR